MKHKNTIVWVIDAAFVAFLIWYCIHDPENYIWIALLVWVFLRRTFTGDGKN